jgi:hypothetical protein
VTGLVRVPSSNSNELKKSSAEAKERERNKQEVREGTAGHCSFLECGVDSK